MKIVKWETDTGEARRTEMPTIREVCRRCDGNGVHDPAAFDCGFTQPDFAEDTDFAEEYFSGRYDVTCTECNGRNVVDYMDLGSPLTSEQQDYLNWLSLENDALAYIQAEQDSERQMGY